MSSEGTLIPGPSLMAHHLLLRIFIFDSPCWRLGSGDYVSLVSQKNIEIGSSISLSRREGSHYFSVLNLRKESFVRDRLSRANGELPLCLRDFRILISPVTPFPMESRTIIILGAATGPRSQLEPTRKSSHPQCELEPRVGILSIYPTGLGSGRITNVRGRSEPMPPKAPTTRSRME